MATVKVRIAVAVDRKGDWYAYGSTHADDASMMDNAVDCVEEGEAQYFLTAELEIPEAISAEVVATVERATDAISVGAQDSIESK